MQLQIQPLMPRSGTLSPFFILGASKGSSADSDASTRLRMEQEGVGLVSAQQLMEASTHPRQEASAYLAEHKILTLFERLTSLLVFHKPANPRAFLIDQLEKIQRSSNLGEVNYLTLFEPTDLEALFRLMDPADSGVVTSAQVAMALSDMRALSDNVSKKLEEGPATYGLEAFQKLGYEGLASL